MLLLHLVIGLFFWQATAATVFDVLFDIFDSDTKFSATADWGQFATKQELPHAFGGDSIAGFRLLWTQDPERMVLPVRFFFGIFRHVREAISYFGTTEDGGCH